LFFQIGAGAVQMLADAVAVYPDEQMAGLLLWGREGEIAWLEVHDMHPDASHRVPEIANLRTWEECGGLLGRRRT
jgi:hypothetical protein